MMTGRALLDLDTRFMRSALELAGQARDSGEVPVGAVVVLGEQTVGRGRNSPIALRDPTAHAEILALRDAAARVGNYRLVGATLYSTIEPCLMCLGAMLHARIERLVYAAADPKVSATARLESLERLGAVLNHAFEIRGGVLAEEAAALLVDFFRERRPDSGRRTVE